MSTLKPLSEEQIAQFYREGYVVVRGLVPLETVKQAREAFTAPVEGNRWIPGIFDYNNTDAADPLQHRILVEPNVVAAIEQIFEAPARVYFGMTAVVPANGGNGLPWHQDNQYGQMLGMALNTFVALCDITPDKAILWVAPKSHLAGTQPSKEAGGIHGSHRTGLVDPENGIPLETMHPGDVCIFDRNTYHRSLKNDTNEHRYAYAAQYCAEYARRAQTGKKDETRRPVAELQAKWKDVLGL